MLLLSYTFRRSLIVSFYHSKWVKSVEMVLWAYQHEKLNSHVDINQDRIRSDCEPCN